MYSLAVAAFLALTAYAHAQDPLIYVEVNPTTDEVEDVERRYTPELVQELQSAKAFPMDGIGRLGHDPPHGPSADWRVLTTADAAGTNGLTCLVKHEGAQDSIFFWSPIQ
ncbi:hypothetical protein evm_003647 [Chilo suppressalis]|nr:hypothetical protein evm_003647 [Chilo suppressalis]